MARITIDTESIHDLSFIFGIVLLFLYIKYGKRLGNILVEQIRKRRAKRTKTVDTHGKSSSFDELPGKEKTPQRRASLSDTNESLSNTNTRNSRVGIRLMTVDQPDSRTTSDHNYHYGLYKGTEDNGYEISYRRPPSKIKLEWVSKPTTVLIVKKWKDQQVTQSLIQMADWLHSLHDIHILVEQETHKELPYLETFEDAASLRDRIDFIVCLGGDGTVLHVSSLFQKSVPPIIAFNLGSMGFLSPFSFKSFKDDIGVVLRGKCFVKLRLRLMCTVVNKDGKEKQTFHILNEVVIDRGNSPFLSSLECYCDDRMITTVQADGIIVATATGSTAYSLSAGGSLVHPVLPAILFTPICPHSLSFRPVVLPASVVLKVQVPNDASCSAYVSFDGRGRTELQPGDAVRIRISDWPVPTVSKSSQTVEWFQSLAQHLNWNKRVRQKVKSNDQEEQSIPSSPSSTSAMSTASSSLIDDSPTVSHFVMQNDSRKPRRRSSESLLRTSVDW